MKKQQQTCTSLYELDLITKNAESDEDIMNILEKEIFREFKDDMARPAFTQDIEYDLEKDGTSIIGFKGLRIEVLRATNIDITYKVLKDYK